MRIAFIKHEIDIQNKIQRLWNLNQEKENYTCRHVLGCCNKPYFLHIKTICED